MFFTVIVPIYKVEKYLKRCIDSILSQTFSDFELILVDDGSPDRCPEICDAYAEKDNRIRVIHKENGGLVSARQAGARVAEGEYVFNVDSDDAITEDALQSAYDIIRETQADMVSFSYRVYRGGVLSDPIHDMPEEGLYRGTALETEIYPHLISDCNMEHMFYFLWGKAIRRTLLLPHQLHVNTAISLGEDLSCSVPCYFAAKSVYISRKVAYLYTIRDDSISTTFRPEQVTQVADVISCLKVSSAPKPQDFDKQISRYSCFMCFAILAQAAEGKHFKSVKELRKRMENSVHREEMPKAEFDRLTTKSRIAIRLMQKGKLKTAAYFLYGCKMIKCILKRG